MNKKTVAFIILGIIAVLLIGYATVWAVTDLPRLIPPPKAVVSETPYTGTVNGWEGLSMTIDPDSVTSTSATLTIHNDTGHNLASNPSNALRIHVLRGGQWYPVALRTDRRAVTDVPSILAYYPAGDLTYTKSVSWKSFLGRLEPGHYRLVWEFWIHDGENPSSPGVNLSAEFDMK